MESSFGAHSGARGPRARAERGARLLAALIASLAILAAGCGSKKQPGASDMDQGATSESEAGSASKEGTSKTAPKASTTTGKSTKTAGKTTSKTTGAKAAPKAAETPAGEGQIRLVDRGCVSFEPRWPSIRVGQALVWQSSLKKSVTIHVPAGVFDRDEFVVPAGKTVRTGPAREPGDHPMWSLPAACQAAPHGVQGAGPGVSVEAGGS